MDARSTDGSEDFGPGDRYFPRENDRKFVVALARGLEVLRAFKVRDGFLGNQEIAERTGLPKPTVTRLTYTLCELGYLTQIPRLGKYQLAPAVIKLGYSALANTGIRQVARPLMREAADRLAAPVALGVLDRDRALYVDIARGSSAFTVQLEIGARIPLGKTAMGWALIAVMEPVEREETFVRLAEHHGPEWPAMRALIEAAVADYPRKGFVSSPGTWRSDIHAVGVALRTADGSGIYAINCGGPPHQFTSVAMENIYGPAIRELVRRIEGLLGGR